VISVRSHLTGKLAPADERAVVLGRWSGRAMARRLLDGAGLGDVRMRRCGFRLGTGRVWRAGADGRVRGIGVERCGNGRCCPVCGPAQGAVRAAEVGAGTWRWMTGGPGRSAVFVSVAASHRSTDRLEVLHDQLLTARSAVMASDSGAWRAFRRRFGVADLAWRVEHNIGPAGPHVGLHLVLLTTRWWTAGDAQQAEAWLVVRLRVELEVAGFTGRLSAEHGVDVRPVDDPAGVGKYLAKWGIGAELASTGDKAGRNGVNVALTAVPQLLAAELGRADPYGRRYRHDPDHRRLVDGWADYVRLAADDRRRWYRGFARLRDLVPELAGVDRPAERIAVCTAVLPEELRPARYTDAEDDDDQADDDAPMLTVTAEAWRAARRRWFQPATVPTHWHRRRMRWLDGAHGPPVPLELAVSWLAEDDGLEVAAYALAELAGCSVTGDATGWAVG